MSLLRNWWILIAVVAIGAAIFAFVWLRGGVVDDGPVMALPSAYAAGIAAAERGDWSAASQAFDEALKADPNAPPLLFALGTAHIEAGRPLTGAIYLSAYREALPNAANASRARARLEAILAIYRDAAKDMAAEAIAQLDAIIEDDVRAQRAQWMVGMLIDLDGAPADFEALARKQPKGVASATFAHLVQRGMHVSAPEQAFALLTTAIEAEADAAALDVNRAACSPYVPIVASPVCSTLSPEEARACYERQAGVGSTRVIASPGNRAAHATYLYFYAAAHAWTHGGDAEKFVRPLAARYNEQAARQTPTDPGHRPTTCSGWPGEQIAVIGLNNGMVEGWLREGRIDLSRPPRTAQPVVQPAAWKDWRSVVAAQRVDVGPGRIELAFDDPVFGDLADGVRVIEREPAAVRAERLMALASKLGLLVERMSPP